MYFVLLLCDPCLTCFLRPTVLVIEFFIQQFVSLPREIFNGLDFLAVTVFTNPVFDLDWILLAGEIRCCGPNIEVGWTRKRLAMIVSHSRLETICLTHVEGTVREIENVYKPTSR